MLAPVATILLVDDDALLVHSVSFLLRQEGYRVVPAASAAEALAAAQAAAPDVVLLDVALPDLSGVEVCRRLRQQTCVPIIILSARRAEADKIVGLDAGADDYVTKPIGAGELAARVRAALRRGRRAAGPEPARERLVAGEVVVDVAAHRVYVRGREIALSPREFALLHLLVAHAGRTLERQFIFEQVWGPHFYGDQSALDVYIRQLRRKIEQDPARPVLVETVRGVGYRFAAAPP
ncbi:MAG TPA: response regulator transcription factor [Chloroflexota bacterium]|nr:response regulator transcription factor [Chloroflexota bacterium]